MMIEILKFLFSSFCFVTSAAFSCKISGNLIRDDWIFALCDNIITKIMLLRAAVLCAAHVGAAGLAEGSVIRFQTMRDSHVRKDTLLNSTGRGFLT
jgi:hypothetical protein